jgi:hypothetical protein
MRKIAGHFPSCPRPIFSNRWIATFSDVDLDEFVRANWMWERRPGLLLGESFLGYLIALLVEFGLLSIPNLGILVALGCLSGMLLLVARDMVRLVRWRNQYESSIARLIRSLAK